MARGTAKYPTLRDIRLATEAMQGSVFDAQIIKKGEQQIMQFFLEFSGENKLTVLDFLEEVILHPRFYEHHIEGEIENLKNRIEGRINNRSEYAKLKCFENMCQDEPFGIYGDGYAEDLPGTPPAEHYKKIMQNSPIDFFALGKWDAPWLENEITSRFGKLDNRLKILNSGTREARKTRQIIEIKHGSNQGNLCIGLRGNVSPLGLDFIHLLLANELLGSGPNAKLFTNIREKKSLCYSIFSTVYRFKSIMCIQAGCEPHMMSTVLELAEQEINELKNGNFGKEDFITAKHSLAKQWQTLSDKPSACVDFAASQYLIGDPRSTSDLLNLLDDAEAEGVQNVASLLNIDTVVMMQ